MGSGFGMGGGWWIGMTIFWVALIVLAVWLVRYMFSSSNSQGGSRRDDGWRETPQQTLDRRYAAGEIDEETYQAMRATLRSSRPSRQDER